MFEHMFAPILRRISGRGQRKEGGTPERRGTPVETARIVERLETPRGELVLRQRGDHYEIISNGVFLMATYDGRSERLLARFGLEAAAAPRRVLVGGLGVGFTLAAVLAHRGVQQVTVVEIEPAVIQWQQRYLAPWSGRALDDPRVSVIEADLILWLAQAPASSWDAALLDIDNGPNWTVTPGNAGLYDDAGLTALRRVLRPGGSAAFWSAAEDTAFETRLARHFGTVTRRLVPRRRGAPDALYRVTRP